MYPLNTFYPTLVFKDYIIDPSIINHLIKDTDKKRKMNMIIQINLILIFIL